MTYAVQALYMDQDEYGPDWCGRHVVFPDGQSIGPLDDRAEAVELAAEINADLRGQRPWSKPQVMERATTITRRFLKPQNRKA